MSLSRTLLALASLSLPAAAQSLNLRYGPGQPAPAPTYGAMTGQAGMWNPLKTPSQNTIVNQLVGLDGAATSVSAVLTGCDAYACGVGGYGSNVESLFQSAVNGDCYADPSSTTLEGLAAGRYVLTAVDSPCFSSSAPLAVSLSDQSYNASAQLGGDYLGSFASMTLGGFEFDLNAGVDVRLTSNAVGYMSALQVAKIEPPTVFCTAKVNSQGCTAKIAAIGNTASLSGAQPFHVVATDVINDVPGLLFYGFAEDIKPFMGGLHCVKPPTPRTTFQLSGGNGVPCAGTFDLDVNTWLALSPLPTVYAGARLYAQYWYRDPADPFGAATSDAVSFHVVH